MEQAVRADRGRQLRLDSEAMSALPGRCFALTRLGGASIGPGLFSALVQLRGRAWMESREGHFGLTRGDWIMFERDSLPQAQVDQRGLCIGVVLDQASMEALERLTGHTLYPGLGHLSAGARLTALHLWREAGAGAQLAALRPLLMYLKDIEMELADRALACPGRSRGHKRQVFARMQRARMFLEGHPDQVVRIDELARTANFSSWYFSKAFHALYGESPQAYSARLRLGRAAMLLRTTGMTVGEVAAASGFENCCSFARAFRARHGISASQYRKQPISGQDRQNERAPGAKPRPQPASTVAMRLTHH